MDVIIFLVRAQKKHGGEHLRGCESLEIEIRTFVDTSGEDSKRMRNMLLKPRRKQDIKLTFTSVENRAYKQ
jgi:hypothetical protein